MSEITLEDYSFHECLRKDSDLAALRARYAKADPADRRAAADWNYHQSIATQAFDRALVGAGQDPFTNNPWPEGVLALAIDPLYAPALLTVGSIEYQLGRVEEGFELLMRLTTLPDDEPDLHTIIDKAGDCMLDEQDFESALKLWQAASNRFPDVALHHIGLCFCHGKLGHHAEAVAHARRADELEPDNPEHLNDLGWSLFEAGRLEDAEQILRRAIALSPETYAFPRNNLEAVLEKRGHSGSE